MKIMKFGGTSVGTVESLKKVKAIVESEKDRAIVVVSALGGVTDLLLKVAEMAGNGVSEWNDVFLKIERRHFDIIDNLIPKNNRELFQRRISEMLSDLKDIYLGVGLLKEVSEKTRCQIVSFGERMSSFIISGILNGAKLFDSLQFIKTEKWFDKNIAVKGLTDSLIKETFGKDSEWKLAVVPGFISTDVETGDITNLGRGGSDYTASLIAASLSADILEIWTDVDGFMTADPRIIKQAKVIDELSFIESMDLCNFGAKVIYPPTIYPVFHKNIPILIKNTFNSSAPGTLITDNSESGMSLKGVSSINNVTLLKAVLHDFKDASGFFNTVMNALSKQGVEILLSSVVDESENCELSIALRDTESDVAIKKLSDEISIIKADGVVSELSIFRDLAVITVVGKDMKYSTGTGARIINTLQRSNLDVVMSAVGASEISFSVILHSARASEGLEVIHDNFLI